MTTVERTLVDGSHGDQIGSVRQADVGFELFVLEA
jgi:hypothetical protein